MDPAGSSNQMPPVTAAQPAATPTTAAPTLSSLSIGQGAPIERSPSRSSSGRHSTAAHRQSFVENLRNTPPSPRTHRVPSFTHQAVQGLVNNPPPQRQANPYFAGRDWRDIAVGELLLEDDLKWADLDTSVEDCTKLLLRGHASGNAVLLRGSSADQMPVATFDHNDLNAYLLAVIGMATPEPEDVAVYRSIAERAKDRVAIPVRDIQPICRREPISTILVTNTLPRAIELFGSGVHRILVTSRSSPTSEQVVGVLSQLRLLQFFWNESVNFPMIDRLYLATLRDLRIGSQEIFAINADSPLSDALTLMNNEGLTSVAVVDNGLNVVGNISTTDVEHLTSVASFPLLQQSCMHFVSVILSERGVEQGRDSFPVFYVNPHSTLAHTVAKLVATRSHRMWVVDSASPAPSAPQTPLLAPVQSASSVPSGSSAAVISPLPLQSPPNHNRNASFSATATAITANDVNITAAVPRDPVILIPDTNSSSSVPQSPIPLTPHNASSSVAGLGGSGNGSGSVPAAALPGAHLSGRLTGVVSLTDVLNLFARTTGLNPSDPAELRARRRRSSSSSLRPSLDGSRTSVDLRR